MKVGIKTPALLAPGLPHWQDALPVLRGESEYQAAAMAKIVPEILPATERRRCAESAKLALHVAWEAVRDSGTDPASVASVFASSGGGSDISRRICLSLTEPEPFVSPTLFHNSVHNAAAGYWSIASGSMQSSNSLSAYDWTALAGLQAAMAQVLADQVPVLLVLYDQPAEEPIYATRPLVGAFGVALLLMPPDSEGLTATLSLQAAPADAAPTGCADPGLEQLRQGNPAARSLPLLQCLAGAGGAVVLEGPRDSRWSVGIEPCA